MLSAGQLDALKDRWCLAGLVVLAGMLPALGIFWLLRINPSPWVAGAFLGVGTLCVMRGLWLEREYKRYERLYIETLRTPDNVLGALGGVGNKAYVLARELLENGVGPYEWSRVAGLLENDDHRDGYQELTSQGWFGLGRSGRFEWSDKLWASVKIRHQMADDWSAPHRQEPDMPGDSIAMLGQ